MKLTEIMDEADAIVAKGRSSYFTHDAGAARALEMLPRLVAALRAAVEHAPQIEGFCIQAEAEARAPGGQRAGLDKSWASRVNPSVKEELRWYARDFRELLDALAVGGEEGK